ncbi:MAG: hypothetical protein ABS904_00760 [Solibacillus isronensis]
MTKLRELETAYFIVARQAQKEGEVSTETSPIINIVPDSYSPDPIRVKLNHAAMNNPKENIVYTVESVGEIPTVDHILKDYEPEEKSSHTKTQGVTADFRKKD